MQTRCEPERASSSCASVLSKHRVELTANLRAQKPKPYLPRAREQNERRGDVVAARFFSGGLWVLEVWTRETGMWMVLMSQVTTATP